MWTTHLLNQQCNSISGMARLTSRQGHLRRSGSKRYRDLCCGSRIRIRQLAGQPIPVIAERERLVETPYDSFGFRQAT
jgi:hypothetical protein